MNSESEKIYIDFQGGSHGNYLEFVCNRFLAKIPTRLSLPFNSQGAAHRKPYLEDSRFVANHYTTYGMVLHDATVISIHIDPDDLLPLQLVSLLRCGDFNIRPDELEIDTYHKLNNDQYRWVLDNIIGSFFDTCYFIDGYNAIADSSWPRVCSRLDFEQLPKDIQHECISQHGFEWPIFDETHPDCPRHILREFFELGFRVPEQSGFIKSQLKQIHTDCRIYYFPFRSFYDINDFVQELHKLSNWLHQDFDPNDQALLDLHQEFLQRQPFKDSKLMCDQIVKDLITDPHGQLPCLDVIQEAYIASKLPVQRFR